MIRKSDYHSKQKDQQDRKLADESICIEIVSKLTEAKIFGKS